MNSYILTFGEVAAANAWLTALVDRNGKRSTSYAELDRMRLAVASKLLSMGLEPDAPVILNMGRCCEYVAAWLGVMTAGCANVPLEPWYPECRVEFIRKDCGATVVIDEAFMEELPAADKDAVRIVPGNTPAHIVYTSGSTGRPKGVIHTVDSIYRMACGNSFLVDIGERPVFATCDSFTFIISVYETLAPLGLGGEVHIMDEIVRKDVTMQSDYYIKHNINIGHVTPQLLRSFYCKSKRLKRVLTGGELVSGVYCPDYEIVVLYGSSEMGIICSFKIDKPYFGAWRAMEELYEAGRIRAIGISNFMPDRVVDFCRTVRILPAVNQIEIHPFCQRRDDLGILSGFGVQPEAWSSFASGLFGIFSNPVLKTIAESHGKTIAQIILRWNVERGVVAISKSLHKSRLEENLNVFDFALSQEDHSAIAGLDTGSPMLLDLRNPNNVSAFYDFCEHL